MSKQGKNTNTGDKECCWFVREDNTMGLRINTNIEAFNSHRALSKANLGLAKSMARLSSGLRINSAGDDAAGLSIAEKLRAQVRGYAQAQRNAQDGISFVQTAEGGLQEYHAILQRIRDLAVQFNNGVYDDAAKAAITAEVQQLSLELDRIATRSKYNGVALLSVDTTISPILATFQVGGESGDIITLGSVNVTNSMAVYITDFVNAASNATINIDNLNTAIGEVSKIRSSFGAVQNRLEHAINYLGMSQETLAQAESHIRDVDMAAEMTTFTKLQVLQQSGTAMLAQANASSAVILNLLK